MRRTLTSIVLAAGAVAGMQMHAQGTSTLEALRDHKRVLLIFAGSDDRRVARQWGTLATARKAAEERDLVAVLLTRSGTRLQDGDAPPHVALQDDEQTLRQRFHVSPGQFTVLLIGKDGGEKLRSQEPIAWDTLQRTIDAMPMRQSEMRYSH